VIGGPPKIGWVIRYVYDWSGVEIGKSVRAEKERPAVIVLAVSRKESAILVRVAPITHRPPDDMSRAVEILASTKIRLGLDGERSWIVLDHANEFLWPGPDLRPIPGREPPSIYYGPLPPGLFDQVRAKLLALLRAGRVRGLMR